ncbi:AcrR family transcriptional regulator [Parvibaculum indicum]|uniref:TetR/AcrR family transcriptional regulator n=1 Tax=Parvibaculum indicum TaxID=562969 RepID=UPI0019625081|nr:TetR/AcrR family transcriptional regulator [Parvibaculum indicum]NIJ41150.1 AcrR family transcriptional regulator [Parvibaculum indicum]
MQKAKNTSRTTPRQRMSVTDRREQILDTTRDMVDAEGFHAVTLDRVAGECGITRTVIYQQFGNLSDLLLAMVDREYERAAESFSLASQRAEGKGRSRFAAGVAGVLEAVDASPATWRMLLMPSPGGPPELYDRLEQGRALTRAHFSEALAKEGMGASPRANPDSELAVHMLLAVSEELVHLRLTDPKAYTTERLIAQAEWLFKAMFPG